MLDFNTVIELLQNTRKRDKTRKAHSLYEAQYKNFTSFFVDLFILASHFTLKH